MSDKKFVVKYGRYSYVRLPMTSHHMGPRHMLVDSIEEATKFTEIEASLAMMTVRLVEISGSYHPPHPFYPSFGPELTVEEYVAPAAEPVIPPAPPAYP